MLPPAACRIHQIRVFSIDLLCPSAVCCLASRSCWRNKFDSVSMRVRFEPMIPETWRLRGRSCGAIVTFVACAKNKSC